MNLALWSLAHSPMDLVVFVCHVATVHQVELASVQRMLEKKEVDTEEALLQVAPLAR